MKKITLSRFFSLVLFLFSISLSYGQSFDGSYDPCSGTEGDEYAGAATLMPASVATGTCAIQQVWAKVDTNTGILQLGFRNGNSGSALFRIYINSDDSTGALTNYFGKTNVDIYGADYYLEIEVNDNKTKSTTKLYSTLDDSEITNSAVEGKLGDYCDVKGVFFEIQVNFVALGIDICDSNTANSLNITSYASVAGNSPNSNICLYQPLDFDVDLTGTINGGDTYCYGETAGNLNLTVSEGGNPVVEYWEYMAPGTSSFVNIGNGGSFSFNPNTLTLNEGTHTFRVQILDNSGVCSDTFASGEAQIIVNPLPNVDAGSYGPFCIDDELVNLVGSPSGGMWTGTGVSGDQQNGYTFNPAQGTQTLTYTYSDSNSCENSDVVEIIVNEVPQEVSAGADQTLTCSVTSVTLQGSSTTPDVSYQWTGPNGFSSTEQMPEVSEAGIYDLTVTSLNGCTSSASVEVLLDTTEPTVSIEGNTELTCNSQSIVLNASSSEVVGTASYTWSTGETTASIELTEAGEYSVTVTDSDNGCSTTQTIEVTFDDTPEELTGNSIVLCSIDDVYDLNSLLPSGYVEGGTWSDDFNSGGLNDNQFDPSQVNLSNYEFTYTEPDVCGRKIVVLVNVNDDCIVLPCESEENITISKVVTANNDGYNDVFEISDVASCGFSVAVKIFNRWGKMVYESDNYQNTWRGYHDNSGMTLNTDAKLPAGTYYYVVQIVGSGYKPITGYIYLGTN